MEARSDLTPERDVTLVEALVEGAQQGAPLAIFHGSGAPRRFDARAALSSTLRWASALALVGARRGEPVAIMLPASEDFVGALFGALWIGAIPMPIAAPTIFGGLHRDLERITRAVTHAGAKVLVASSRVLDAVAETSLATQLDAGAAPEEVAHLVAPVPVAALDAGRPALLQYTSGATGEPKGVLLSHRAIVANARAIAERLRLSERDVGVSWLPLHHDMGLVGALLTAVVRPYTLHFLPAESFAMRPRRWLELIGETRATISVAPHSAYDLVARRTSAEGLDLSSWRAALDGAEPIHPSALRRFSARFAAAGFSASALSPAYGLTEATLAVTMGTPGQRARTISVDREALCRGRVVPSHRSDARELVGLGCPVRGTSIAIVDHGGRELPEGRVGEVVVRGPSLMSGYYRDPRESARALSNGQLRTGDLGFVHDGELYVVGRLRAAVTGRDVHPEGVERVALDAAGAGPAGERA